MAIALPEIDRLSTQAIDCQSLKPLVDAATRHMYNQRHFNLQRACIPDAVSPRLPCKTQAALS
jgi:hypothetical protein